MIGNKQKISIPLKGEKSDLILQQLQNMKKDDAAWKDGKVWSLVYYFDEEHDQLLKAANNEFISTNYLNPFAFKSLHRMEQEVVRMSANLQHGDKHTVGVMTTGGTESILLAMYCYRERARKLHPNITNPEVITTETIHPAFDKAALLFDLQLRKAPVDENRCVIPEKMEQLINENTILMVASAPNYPSGTMDPIEAIADTATQYHLPLHVDGCIGGFMLPWVEKLGYEVPPWDYRIKGVSSISADVHKFGFGVKGASVLTYRNMDYLHHQFVVTTDYPGGIYISPTLLGTRPGGPIAAAWAGMKHLGEEGYLAKADKLMQGARQLYDGLSAIPGILIVGKPCMNLLSYKTKDNKPDIFVIADYLENKGWTVERQQLPVSIHLTILPTNVERIDEYLADLKEALEYARAHPGAVARGNAAIYGFMTRFPLRGMIQQSVKKIMEDLYGGGKARQYRVDSDSVVHKPFWMGWMNRLFTIWDSWKQRLKKVKINLLLIIFLGLVFGYTPNLWSQPFVDLFQIRYTHALGDNHSTATPFTHLWMGSDLPIKLQENTYLLLSPYYEKWELDTDNEESIYPPVQSLTFPVGLILPLKNTPWSITAIPMLRWNGETLFDQNTFQFGGAFLATYIRKPQQKFRFGVYANKEFFGWFIMPLVGTDWRIDDRNYLFGTLPGRLAFEHQLGKNWYTGASFRAPTNSFRMANGEFIRLADNQLSLYLDYYFAQHLCITLEPGVGVFRNLRTGVNNRDYLTKVNWSDGFFIRLNASYRLRL